MTSVMSCMVAPQRYIHILLLRTYDITLSGKRVFIDVIKLRIFDGKDILDYMNGHKVLYKKTVIRIKEDLRIGAQVRVR